MAERTFYLGLWESMKDLRGRGAVRGRGDSQCKGARTHVRHRGLKI